MDTATLVSFVLNGLLTVAGALFGFVLRAIKQQLDEQRTELAALRDRMTDQCVRRDDYTMMRSEVLSQLERIDSKLDRLAQRLTRETGGPYDQG